VRSSWTSAVIGCETDRIGSAPARCIGIWLKCHEPDVASRFYGKHWIQVFTRHEEVLVVVSKSDERRMAVHPRCRYESLPLNCSPNSMRRRNASNRIWQSDINHPAARSPSPSASHEHSRPPCFEHRRSSTDKHHPSIVTALREVRPLFGKQLRCPR
jgi:hypothetical protein